MKRSVVVLALAVVLGLAVSAMAQVQGGTIGGKVQDEQGGVLPGVTLTLQGVDATRETVTGAAQNLSPRIARVGLTVGF